jgi:hypothetical protein
MRGHDALSCDIIDSETPGPHYKGDVRDILDNQWDLMIAHPPCTYLAVSGLHWNTRIPARAALTDEALKFIELLWNAPVDKVCIENPVGCINSRIPYMPKPQYIQPYQFGADASKKTGLWKRGLPDLQPTKYVPPRNISGKDRWSNQTDSGQNKLTPSPQRAADRSRTYPGIALAMAEQWG